MHFFARLNATCRSLPVPTATVRFRSFQFRGSISVKVDSLNKYCLGPGPMPICRSFFFLSFFLFWLACDGGCAHWNDKWKSAAVFGQFNQPRCVDYGQRALTTVAPPLPLITECHQQSQLCHRTTNYFLINLCSAVLPFNSYLPTIVNSFTHN